MFTAAFSPDGRLVAAVDVFSRKVLVWDVAARIQVATLPENSARTWAVAWSPDGKRLACAGSRGVATVWALAPSECQISRLTIGIPTLPGGAKLEGKQLSLRAASSLTATVEALDRGFVQTRRMLLVR